MMLTVSARAGLLALLLWIPGPSLADAFDVTMTVVGQGESFDETVVNRIVLPFGQAAGGETDTTAAQNEPDTLRRLPPLWQAERNPNARERAPAQIPQLDAGLR